MLHHDHTEKVTIRHLSRPIRAHGIGPTDNELYPVFGDSRDNRPAGRAPQPEQVRGGGAGGSGAPEKDTLTPCAVITASYSEGMGKTLSIRGREYTVETVEGAKELRYRLTGKRGGSFFTMRNAHKPHLMFIVADALGNKSLDRVWLSDESGDLVVVQGR